MGVYLIVDSAMGLLRGEHPPVGTVGLFGHAVWAGWVMIAAMVYTAIGPVILGRMKLPLGTVKSWIRRSLLSLKECLG